MENINYSSLILLKKDTPVKCVVCVFEDKNHAPEHFFKTLLNDLKIGDLVAVESDSRFGINIAKVVKVEEVLDWVDETDTIRWIYSKIDTSAIVKIKELELTTAGLVKKSQIVKRHKGILQDLHDSLDSLNINLEELPINDIKLLS